MFIFVFYVLCVAASAAILAYWRIFEMKLGTFLGYYQLLLYRDGRGRSDIFAVSAYFLRYVESFRLAAGKIARGDFTIRVVRKNYKRGADSEYLHELKTPLSIISGYCKIA